MCTRVRQLIEFASTVYRYVVLDCPRSDATLLEALDAASTVIIIANQELATLRNATRIASALRQRCGPHRVKLALSRLDPGADISRQDVERVLGGPVKYTFPERLSDVARGAQPRRAADHAEPQQPRVQFRGVRSRRCRSARANRRSRRRQVCSDD